MVPIFDFISPTFIYSFLEEKVQSSNNYLICVDFSLYAREINTKEISSVVLDCKCHLKIQPIGPVSLIPTGSVALSTSNTLWGKNQHCSQRGNWGLRRLKSVAGESQAWVVPCSRTGGFPGAVLDFRSLQYLLQHKQHRGQESLPALPHRGSNKGKG